MASGNQAIIGTGVWANDFTRTLEFLTGNKSLQFLTMLSWANALSVRELIRPTRAWCPLCFEEAREKEKPVYEPLLWSLELVDTCPIHHISLQVKCGFCGQNSLLLERNARCGYCFKCYRWLGQKTVCVDEPINIADQDSDWSKWVNKSISEILIHPASQETEPERTSFASNLSGLIDIYTGGSVRAFTRLINRSWKTVKGWQDGEQLPTLRSLLEIGYQFEIAPIQLLTGKLPSQSLPDHPISLPFSQQKTNHKKYKSNGDLLKEEEYLKNYLAQNDIEPISLREIARRLSHDPAHLAALFPDLCQQVISRYANFLMVKKENRKAEIKSTIRNHTIQIYSNRQYPSLHAVADTLENPGIMREPAARQAWKDTLKELGVLRK